MPTPEDGSEFRNVHDEHAHAPLCSFCPAVSLDLVFGFGFGFRKGGGSVSVFGFRLRLRDRGWWCKREKGRRLHLSLSLKFEATWLRLLLSRDCLALSCDCLVLPCVLPCLVLSCLVLSCLVLYCLVFSCLMIVLSRDCRVLSCFVYKPKGDNIRQGEARREYKSI